MNSLGSSPSVSATKSSFACIRCSERKVRCDKRNPCNTCVRHNVQCIFRPANISRRKRKLARDPLLDEQLKRYETLLREKGIDPQQVAGTVETEHNRDSSCSEELETVWQLPTPDSTASGPQKTIFKPQLLHGQRGTKLVDNSLWSRVAEEIHSAEDGPEEDSASDASDAEASNEDYSYLLGSKMPSTASHPPVQLIHKLWQVFIENVNPLSKLVHVPSLQSAIEKAITNFDCIPRGFEALMFAIYSMAVLSLSEAECQEMLGNTRAILLPYYVAATKAALSRARFMSSTSIVVLQALVLHILSIRDGSDARAVWSLTGATIRIAEGMGMRLDGTLLGLSPFETEIHRRIWWQLKMHDFRAAELSGQAKFRNFDIGESTPKKPTNVNDSDLYPSMPQAPVESTKPTEMMWCVFRSDLAIFAASQKVNMQKSGKAVAASEEYSAMDNLKLKDGFIQKLEDMIETKYLRFCDPSQPLQLLTLLGARCSANLVRFVAHHPRRWAALDHIPASEQQLVWDIVIQLLEQYDMMQSSPQLRCFAWNVSYFIQWHAVIHVLDTLRAEPLHQDAVKAWRLIDKLYANNLEMLMSVKKPIVVAVGNLCLKAYSAQVVAFTKENRNLADPPDYILKLREQREAAKARREAVMVRNMGKETLDSVQRLTTADVDTTRLDIELGSAKAQTMTQPQQNPTIEQPADQFQGSNWTGDDAFWLGNVVDDDSFAGGAADPMNIDTDAILTQDYWRDTPGGETIDWAQWDAWLGNLDTGRANVGAGAG